MAQEFRLPDPGEGIHEAEVVEVLVEPGDEVEDGDPLFTIETDKAVTDVPAAFNGTVVEVSVSVGDIVEVGEVLLIFDTDGATPSGDEADEDSQEAEEADADAVADADEAEADEEEPEPEKEPEADRADADAVAEAEDADADADDIERPPGPATSTFVRDARPVPASPATRALARHLGVDLHEIAGSGTEGRIEPEDVQAAAGRREPDETEPTEERQEPAGADRDRYGPVERVRMRGLRRATARRMAVSWETIPHVSHHDVADITDLEPFLEEHGEEVEEAGGKLTITVLLVKAAIAALREHPRFNASLEDDELVFKRYYNIGVAVDTDEGLVVPVLRHADGKSILDLSVELVEKAERMRKGERTEEDLRGGTFTITNPGGIGGTGFTPIINHPEVAILGAARSRTVPVIDDMGDPGGGWSMSPRKHLPLVVAFDHRVNDGADAARFLRTVIDNLEDPAQLLLRI